MFDYVVYKPSDGSRGFSERRANSKCACFGHSERDCRRFKAIIAGNLLIGCAICRAWIANCIIGERAGQRSKPGFALKFQRA